MECGDCTACCTLLAVSEINKKAGKSCKYCTTKCSIYSTRPLACKEFSCAYHQMNKVSIKLRPDKCGIIFEKLAEDLMFGTVDPKHKDFTFINGQINHFLNEGINIVLSKQGQPIVYHLDNINPEELLTRVHLIAEK